MSKKESKPISKDKQIAKLKRELKAAKLREVNNARVFAYALDLYRPDPPNILGAKSTPAQELLTLAVKISDQHANSRITVTASPDGTTSVSIEPVAGMSAAKECETTQAAEGPEEEKPAVETEFWNRQGCSFKAYHIEAPQISQRITNLPDAQDALNRINAAFKEAAASPDELQAMQGAIGCATKLA